MIELVLAAALAWPADSMSTASVRAFGTSDWGPREMRQLQKTVTTRWPSPQALMDLWSSTELTPRQRTAILIGGAEFHDPVLLPAILDGLESRDPEIRRAAHYGYRQLIGDVLPPVATDLEAGQVEAVKREVRAVARSLREGSLIDLWLESLLASEGATTGRWRGVVMRRTASQCLLSVDRLVYPEDLPELIAAFEISRDGAVRQGLMRLIEGASLQQFVFKPTGENAGWGTGIYEEGLERLDLKLATFCPRDAETWIAQGLKAMGAPAVRANTAQACVIWRELIQRPYPPWARTIAQQLHGCGAPPFDLSILRSRAQSEVQLVERLDAWFQDEGQRKVRRPQS